MVICLERGADLHMAPMTPLPLTDPDWFYLPGFTFLVLADPGSPRQNPESDCSCSSVLISKASDFLKLAGLQKGRQWKLSTVDQWKTQFWTFLEESDQRVRMSVHQS